MEKTSFSGIGPSYKIDVLWNKFERIRILLRLIAVNVFTPASSATAPYT